MTTAIHLPMRPASDALMFQKMHKSLHRCISSDATAFLPVTCCHICCPFLLQAAISLLLSSIKPAHESLKLSGHVGVKWSGVPL